MSCPLKRHYRAIPFTLALISVVTDVSVCKWPKRSP
jgi:hypothetical protein